MTKVHRPDLRHELSRLKDFQRDTVEHVFSRMYDPIAPARRFLVADEVGLGKTMVARGVVAKVVEQLWDEVDRIDIIYICSNGSIARQNINRLNLSDAKDASLPSRITLLPTVVRGLKERKLNFISLTPQTSFDLKSSLGRFEERALLYWLLPDDWKSAESSVRNLLQGDVGRDAFRRRVQEFEREHIDEGLRVAFHQQLAKHADLKDEFLSIADRFQAWRRDLPVEDRSAQRALVGRLRLELAISCLGALEPDLIILDEFQRFKHLLDGTDQAGDLARELFDFGNARVLLLSATPYKMYTVADEAESDDHFRDFLQTVAFLQNNSARTESFRKCLEGYRNNIFAIAAEGDSEQLIAAKERVEVELRQVMVRTERLAVSADRNGMLVEVPADVTLEDHDVLSYLGLARVAGALDQSDVMEYWKSAPYLLNFMDDYQFKSEFKEALEHKSQAQALSRILAEPQRMLITWDDVERYQPLDPANARLRHAVGQLRETESWRLLWLPPSLPYYGLAGAFAGHECGRLTKRLMFSSWQVVPKVVSAVLSYEAERLMFGDGQEGERPNTAEARDKFRPLLRFARADGRLTAMALFSLLYPSMSLSELGDPLELGREAGQNGKQRLADVLSAIEQRLRPQLKELASGRAEGGAPDASWYWAAPVLLDLARHPQDAKKWLEQANLADVWRNVDEDVPQEEDTVVDAWSAHVEEFVRAAAGHMRLGLQPDDLAEVLAKVALAAPAVVALRALSRLGDGIENLRPVAVRNHAGSIAWAFRSLFNLPEVTAMLRRDESDESYWQRVLEYSAAGGLQSVMDEYVHVLNEWEGVAHRPIHQATRSIAARICQALQLRTATIGLDEISVRGDEIETTDRRMRARYAARFGARQIDEGAGAVRADDVRAAFNSPFWPFVLCSTSVGQEGLDFHLYCHAVVHWNLPSNPVDLEQREGRVHRYKGHAVRKNAALLHGDAAIASDCTDPWSRAFELAKGARHREATDLDPYWVLPVPGGARIERHVPALPLSRDIDRGIALRKTLTVYRMAFGQNRQDDIVEYLSRRFPPDEIAELERQLRIDLAPKRIEEDGLSYTVAMRPTDTDSAVAEQWKRPTARVTLHSAESLLDQFAKVRESQIRIGMEQYRNLLDRFVALRTGG